MKKHSPRVPYTFEHDFVIQLLEALHPLRRVAIREFSATRSCNSQPHGDTNLVKKKHKLNLVTNQNRRRRTHQWDFLRGRQCALSRPKDALPRQKKKFFPVLVTRWVWQDYSPTEECQTSYYTLVRNRTTPTSQASTGSNEAHSLNGQNGWLL